MSFKIPVLISYWVLLRDKQNKMLNFLIENKDRFRLVVDSGAFTAFTQKKVIQVEDYCGWLNDILIPAGKQFNLDGYFQLDVMCDQKATKANLVKHEKLKTSPIPIFTRASDLAELSYLNTLVSLYGWVGLGAIKGQSLQYIKWVLENCKDTKKLHLLGFGDIDFISYYKPKSVDASSWSCGRRFGEFVDPRNKKRVKERYISISQASVYGFQSKDYRVLNDPKYRNCKGNLTNVQGVINCSAYMKSILKFKNIGVTEYLVATSIDELMELKRNYNYFIENKPINLFTKE